jgi:hypothetical protein
MCMSACLPPCLAVHADGSREYDAHNLFGTAMAMRSHAAAAEVMGKRPFMLLRWVSSDDESSAIGVLRCLVATTWALGRLMTGWAQEWPCKAMAALAGHKMLDRQVLD